MWLIDYGDIGVCTSQGRCTDRPDYNLSRQQKSTESQLTILSNYRTHAGLIISCREMRSSYTVSCTLVIKRHSVLTGCHVSLNNVTRLVSGSCRVDKGFSPDNNYSCTWTVNSRIITTLYGVEPFDNCSVTQPEQGTGFYNYTILVNPPSTTGFSQTIVTIGGSTVLQEREASSLPSSTTDIINIGGASVGGAAIVFLLLVLYFLRRKKCATL